MLIADGQNQEGGRCSGNSCQIENGSWAKPEPSGKSKGKQWSKHCSGGVHSALEPEGFAPLAGRRGIGQEGIFGSGADSFAKPVAKSSCEDDRPRPGGTYDGLA